MPAKRKHLAQPSCVAYYCMEYGLHPSFRAYSGGLGILAGDYLKAAHDARYPMVAVGLLWQQGYGEQRVDKDGHITPAFRRYRYAFLKDTRVVVHVQVEGRKVACKVWSCTAFGNVPLYLLDTDLPQNGADATIADRLYGGNGQHRIAQEIVLGCGGYRALKALGLNVRLHHFNEGHPVFAGLDMLREKRAAGRTFAQALAATRPRIVFTTHTPVPAGNEQHPLAALEQAGALQGLTRAQAISLGGDPFNMTAAALRLAHAANAVAELHGEVALKMWAHLRRAAPIVPITNAIHVPTWVDARMLTAADGKDAQLWSNHQRNKAALIRFVAQRTGAKLAPDKLLIAFSRRAATYKRWDLIFGDEGRIGPLLKSGRLQFVFAGKAHPSDASGQAMIDRVLAMSRRFPKAVVFLPNYDMTIGRMLTRGADVWMNCPRRPNEASGTSGMKAAMNGLLNLSTLDGWWPEACAHGVNGWQYGDGRELPSEARQDAHDRKSLYRVIEREVLPTYYDRRADWIAMMRASIRSTRERFSAVRMLADYDRLLYRG